MKPMDECINDVCNEVANILIAKNLAYGNSVAEPVRIFSSANSIEQINVRIDDKLSRIAKGATYGHEDTELDLIGYLLLKRAILMRNSEICED